MGKTASVGLCPSMTLRIIVENLVPLSILARTVTSIILLLLHSISVIWCAEYICGSTYSNKSNSAANPKTTPGVQAPPATCQTNPCTCNEWSCTVSIRSSLLLPAFLDSVGIWMLTIVLSLNIHKSLSDQRAKQSLVLLYALNLKRLYPDFWVASQPTLVLK